MPSAPPAQNEQWSITIKRLVSRRGSSKSTARKAIGSADRLLAINTTKGGVDQVHLRLSAAVVTRLRFGLRRLPRRDFNPNSEAASDAKRRRLVAFFHLGRSSGPTGDGASPTPFCDEGVAATRWPASGLGFNNKLFFSIYLSF